MEALVVHGVGNGINVIAHVGCYVQARACALSFIVSNTVVQTCPLL